MIKRSLFFFLALIMYSCTNNSEKTLYIADNMVDCVGVSKKKCLLIKEELDSEWQNFYDKIEGFDYEEGYNYKLSVSVEEIDNPATDTSSLKYTLIEVIEKNDSPLSILKKGSWMVNSIGNEKEFFRNPWITFDIEKNRIHGSTSCNKFFGGLEINNPKIRVGTIGSTRMAGPDMSVEDLFLKAINKVKYFKFVDNTLHFLAEDNVIIMKLENVEDQA